MIQFILIQNTASVTRLAKWYVPLTHEEKLSLQQQVYRAVHNRPATSTNFLEFKNYKLVYRRYKDLYFIFCIEHHDNELSIFEAIHHCVEILDQYFQRATGNPVSELSIQFSFYKVYLLLDEMFAGGEIVETGSEVCLGAMSLLDNAK